jgi:TetR/AcrR family transcriptional regulator
MLYDESTADTKTLIKIAAKKIFVKRGFAGTRLKEIADEAKIGRTALHYYFHSKENLFAEVLKDFFSAIGSRVTNYGDLDRPVMDIMKQFVGDYIDSAIQTPEIDLFMLNEFNENPELMLMARDSDDNDLPGYLMSAIEKACANGELKGNPEQIFISLMSICMFPFAGMAAIKTFMKLSDEAYIALMKERRAYLLKFVETAFLP